MVLLCKWPAGRTSRSIESHEQGSPLTHQADDSSDNRPKTPKKRTLILREPDLGEVSPDDDLEEIDDPSVETYDDIYDDIDDIDDFDAFEMDNGLTGGELSPNWKQQAPPNTVKHVEQQRHSSILTWNKTPDIGQKISDVRPIEDVRPFDDDDDIRPVPLKRTAVANIQQVHKAVEYQPKEPASDEDMKFGQGSAKAIPPTPPSNSQDQESDLLPERVFAETDKLFEATTPVLQSDNPSADQQVESLPPPASKIRRPGFARSVAPEPKEEHTQNIDNPAASPTFGLTPRAPQAGFEPLFLPPSVSPPKVGPLPDALPTLIVAEGTRLRRFAATMVGDEDEADQLVEATLQHAIAMPNQLAADFDLSVSLFMILYRMRRDSLRRHDQLLMPSLDPSFASIIFQRLPGADRDELQEFAEAMSSLSEEDRAILILISLENLGYREVAKVLGIEVDRVMSQIALAREQLRHALETMAPAMDSHSTVGDIS